jgi:hypothetical protein
MKRLHQLVWGLTGTVAFGFPNARADGPVKSRFDTAEITEQQWQKYLAEVRAGPDVSCEERQDSLQYICDSSAKYTIWIFTLPGHAAHPAVTRGIMLIQNTRNGTIVSIDRSGHYAGDHAAFDTWIRAHAAHDQRQIASLGGQER